MLRDRILLKALGRVDRSRPTGLSVLLNLAER